VSSELEKLLAAGLVQRGSGRREAESDRQSRARTLALAQGHAQIIHNDLPLGARPEVLSTGIPPIDIFLPQNGLKLGCTHEWFGWEDQGPSHWFSPLTILAALALRAFIQVPSAAGLAIWIGRRVWPSPAVLEGVGRGGGRGGGQGVLGRSLFLDPSDTGSRLWAIDQCLRCPDVRVVVADGSGLDMAASRRLQLAAESNPNPVPLRPLVLLARPPRERPPKTISAAETRWVVKPELPPAPGPFPCWRVELLRCKGAPMAQSRSWLIELAPMSSTPGDGRAHPYLAGSPSALRARADVADRPPPAETEARKRIIGA
jgi:protein ImuA